MPSADLDHNDELLAAEKKEKLEWVTPRLTLMEAASTDAKSSPRPLRDARGCIRTVLTILA
jgi:hypothetical protein